MVAFEKTFLNGDASFGMRMPFFQTTFDPAASATLPRGVTIDQFEESAPGDLILVFKGALLKTERHVISTGMTLSLPTGPNPDGFTVDGDVGHYTLFQPFVGYGRFWDRLYVQGFASLMVPDSSDYVTFLFNDIGVGYRIPLCHPLVTELVPTVELHVNTPLNQKQAFVDSANVIAGANIVFANNSSLGLALGSNFTRPQLFELEAQVTFNWRF